MEISITEARDRFTQLIRAVEDGEQIVITRNGKAVAQLVSPQAPRRKVRLGRMKNRIHLRRGWDDPVDVDRLLAGNL